MAKVVEKVMDHQVEDEEVKGTSLKTLAIDVDMVRLILSQFQTSINQMHTLTSDVLAKEIKWMKSFEDMVAKPTIM